MRKSSSAKFRQLCRELKGELASKRDTKVNSALVGSVSVVIVSRNKNTIEKSTRATIDEGLWVTIVE